MSEKIVITGNNIEKESVLNSLSDEVGAENLPEIIFENSPLYDRNIRDTFDAVFVLLSGNKEKDDEITNSWVGTAHLRVSKDQNELINEIKFFLGIPEPLEIERKFLIEYPDVDYLDSLPYCDGVEIVQTYILPPDGERFRIRQRGKNGNYIYFHTVKKHISDYKRIEEERIISEEEYFSYLRDTSTVKHQLSKVRYCLIYENQYFEIDVYPFFSDKAIMEIELKNENDEISFPPFIKITREVTEDKSFTNYALSKAFGNDTINADDI